jgi:hypothetical protein
MIELRYMKKTIFILIIGIFVLATSNVSAITIDQITSLLINSGLITQEQVNNAQNESIDNNFLLGNDSSTYIKIKSPNGGDQYEVGEDIKIKWSSKGIKKEKINIVLLNTDGSSYTLVSNEKNDGKHTITIPNNINSGDYKIKIHPDTTDINDTSDNTFYISGIEDDPESDEPSDDDTSDEPNEDIPTIDPKAKLELKSPNGGVYGYKSLVKVKWNSKGIKNEKINIELKNEDNGTTYTIEEGIKNNRKHNFYMPDLPSGDYQLSITSSESRLSDQSDYTMEIRGTDYDTSTSDSNDDTDTDPEIPVPVDTNKSITILSPRGGEEYIKKVYGYVGGGHISYDLPVRWTSEGINNDKLKITLHNKGQEYVLGNNIFNTGSRNFSLPQTISELTDVNQYLTISSINNPEVSDTTDKEIFVNQYTPGYPIATSFLRPITTGSIGNDVALLQTVLIEQGFLTMPTGVDLGYFGPLTRTALSQFQQANGIYPSNGYFGPITMSFITNTILKPGSGGNLIPSDDAENLLENGDFEEGNFSLNKSGKDNGISFDWDYVSQTKVPGWSANQGSDIEIWEMSSNQFVELDGSSYSYGIEQTVNLSEGEYTLLWKHRPRANSNAGNNSYFVKVINEDTDKSILSPKTFSNNNTNSKWTSNSITFTIPKSSDSVPAKIIFGLDSNNTYGALVDEIKLVKKDPCSGTTEPKDLEYEVENLEVTVFGGPKDSSISSKIMALVNISGNSSTLTPLRFASYPMNKCLKEEQKCVSDTVTTYELLDYDLFKKKNRDGATYTVTVENPYTGKVIKNVPLFDRGPGIKQADCGKFDISSQLAKDLYGEDQVKYKYIDSRNYFEYVKERYPNKDKNDWTPVPAKINATLVKEE